MSVIFMKAADVQALAAAARGDSHDHDEEDAGMYNFCQAYQICILDLYVVHDEWIGGLDCRVAE